MMTVKQYADKRKKSVATIYSWIYRNQAEKNGFTFSKIGTVTMIEEVVKKKQKVTT